MNKKTDKIDLREIERWVSHIPEQEDRDRFNALVAAVRAAIIEEAAVCADRVSFKEARDAKLAALARFTDGDSDG